MLFFLKNASNSKFLKSVVAILTVLLLGAMGCLVYGVVQRFSQGAACPNPRTFGTGIDFQKDHFLKGNLKRVFYLSPKEKVHCVGLWGPYLVLEITKEHSKFPHHNKEKNSDTKTLHPSSFQEKKYGHFKAKGKKILVMDIQDGKILRTIKFLPDHFSSWGKENTEHSYKKHESFPSKKNHKKFKQNKSYTNQSFSSKNFSQKNSFESKKTPEKSP
jgi:hypothetical protein